VTESNPLGKSDHAVILFELICYRDFSSDEFVERYKYDKGNYEKLKEDLTSVQWEEELASLQVDDAWNVFTGILTTAMENNIPKTRPPKAGKGGKKWKPLWMSKEAMRKVKKKYHAWKRYTSTRQYQDFENYKRARNLASKEVKFAKKSFEKNLAGDIKKNPKSFWKYVRSKTKVKTGVHDLEKEDGSFAHTDEDKAEVLNNFFASVFTKEDISDVPDPEYKASGDFLNDISFSEEEVLKKLVNLNPSKSPGPDGIHPRVLKEAAEIIAKPLEIIFNKSMKEGVLPSDWKIAHVTALFKKGKLVRYNLMLHLACSVRYRSHRDFG
jgi:hypothetical protein